MAREGLTEEDKEKLKKEVVKMGLFALRQAKQKAPVDTGRLRASITLADSDGLIQPAGPEAEAGDAVNSSNEQFSVILGTNVNYAKFIEFGTVNRAPQPFLRPAKNQALNRFGFSQS